MEPTPVRVGVMDSARPGLVVTLPVEQLSSRARAWRGAKRTLLVSGIGLLIIPVPLLHLCGVAVAFVAGPIAGVFAWKSTALFGAGEVPCPKCSQSVALTPKLAGWPARVHCQKCGAMVELQPALP